MKKTYFPIVLSSIIALTVGIQSASAVPGIGVAAATTYTATHVASAVADNATGLKTAWAEAWIALSDATIKSGKTVASGVSNAYNNAKEGVVDAYHAVDEWGQEVGRKIDQGLENIKLGAYALAQSAEEMLQEGWQKIGNFYIKVSDATVAYVRTKTCTFKYNIKSVGAGLQAIADLPAEKLSRFMVCMEEMDGWAKMVSKEGHVIGQNVPCVAALAIPQPENLVYALAEVHNARLKAHQQYCGNTGGLTQANADQQTFQTTPANSTVLAPTITPMVPNGTNCTGEGITMGFGKNGVCEPIACDNGYTLTENNGVKTCVKETVKPVQKKAGDPCTTKNAVSARINSEGNCAATECIDGWELARYDNGNSKGFCIKSTPKVEPVVQEPVHIEPLQAQVALLKVDPIGAPDITLKMPQPALAVATPETNQVATAEPVSALDKKLAKLDAQKQALIEKDQAKQLLAQQKAEEEELKRQQKELAEYNKQQAELAKAEEREKELLAKANEREANKAAREKRQEERALAQAERQEARQAAREERQEERALAQAAKDAEREKQEQERQSLGLTQVEYNNYKKNQEKIEQMKINLEQQRQQLNIT